MKSLKNTAFTKTGTNIKSRFQKDDLRSRKLNKTHIHPIETNEKCSPNTTTTTTPAKKTT